MKRIISVISVLLIMCLSMTLLCFSADIDETVEKLDDVTVYNDGDAAVGTYEGDIDDVLILDGDEVIDDVTNFDVSGEETTESIDDFDVDAVIGEDTDAADSTDISEISDDEFAEMVESLLKKPLFIFIFSVIIISLLLFVPMFIVMIVFIVLNSKAKKKLKNYEENPPMQNNYTPERVNDIYNALGCSPEKKEENENE